ncbi:MAG TPA: hypothetical protein VFS27_10495 [Blastocatellia bacterium]|nr:hypothetical protein [Blastocatellia bacterium]
MSKPIFYYIAGILSVTAVLAMLWGFGLILENGFDVGGGDGDYNVINTSPSPDGKYVATVYTGMGGGAAGWCYIRVTLNPVNEPFSIEREKKEGKYMVFNISCNSEVETEWEGDKNLLVSFKVPSSESGFSVYRKPIDWDREIKIRYLEK